MKRNREIYAVCIALAIVAGLLSRAFPGLLPPVFGKYPGDVLWALVVFLVWGWLLAPAPSAVVAVLALLTALTIEMLKLWPHPWLVSLRHSPIGYLLFGHVFSMHNLAAYSIGIATGFVGELLLLPHDASD